MKLLPETLEKITELASLFGAKNRAEAVGRSVEVALMVIRAIKQGDTVAIEGGGMKNRIIIPGVNQ